MEFNDFKKKMNIFAYKAGNTIDLCYVRVTCTAMLQLCCINH